jgi:hypothetical protein
MEDAPMAGLGSFFPTEPGPFNAADSMARQTANAAMQAATNQKSEIELMREHVERLSLLNQAMWELVRDRLQLTDADLEKAAQEVDLRDGKQNGRLSEHPLQCPRCGRVSNSRLKKCMYCGLLFEGDTFG